MKVRYKIVTVDESWICAYEPETKLQSTVWVFEPGPNPTKVVCERITLKQMLACFFCKTGHVATVPLEHRRRVNSEWYTTICLPNVFGEIRKTNKKRRINAYNSNASSRTSAQISAFLNGQNVELMGDLTWHPMTSSYCRISGNYFVVNDFRHQQILLKCSKTMFWR